MNISKARAYFKARHSGDEYSEDPRISFRIRRFWMRSLRSLTRMTFEGGLGIGQSLVEVLVSLSVATLVLSAITVAVIYSLRNATFSKNQNLASQYAAEGMEIVRKIRDSKSSLSGFLDNKKSAKYCLPQDSQELVAKEAVGCGQNVGRLDIGSASNYLYIREVTIDPPASMSPTECEKNYKVTVKVSWSDGACVDRANLFCHKANLISCFEDRAIVPEP